MACVSQTLAGLVQDCDTSKGGIRKVWISTVDPKPTLTTGAISKFEATGVTWFEYNFKKGTSSFTSTLNVDQANGINYVSTELVLQFNKMNTTKRLEMAGLAVNDMWIIVLDSNGIYWYLGYNEAVTATAGTSQSGTAKSDGNFYQITLTDESDTFPYEVLEEALPFGLISNSPSNPGA